MSQSNADLVRELYAAFGRGDVPALLAMLDEEIEWHAPPNLPHGGDFHGREAVGAFFQGIGELWESLEVDLEAVVSSGDRVVALAGAHGRLSGSGEEAAYSAAHVWTIVGGIPVRFDEYVNAPLTLPAAHAVTQPTSL
jgi:ketosteroid isomerase-like protein